MVVRWSECFLCYRPPWWKNDKICNGRSLLCAGTGQHRENAWDAVIKTDAVHDAKIGEVVLVRSIVPMPSNNIEWRVVLFCLEKMALNIPINVTIQILKKN